MHEVYKIYFPNWNNAKLAINNIVEKFDAYVITNKKDKNIVNISFIPFDECRIPPEYDELFMEIYSIFSQWLRKKINLKSIVNGFVDRPNTEQTRHELRSRIKKAIEVFENETGVESKRILAEALGIEIQIMMPMELRIELNALINA